MQDSIRVAELFAGVGGFRVGLEGYDSNTHPEMNKPSAGPFLTVWANQWEPPGKESKQFAAKCYKTRFGDDSVVVEDIEKVLDEYEAKTRNIPDVDMVVGGFPCFVAGTPVLTNQGYKPILKIAVGDMVLTHRGRYRKVVKVGVKHDAPLVKVTIKGSVPLICTPNHPFMVRSAEHTYDSNGSYFEIGNLHTHAAEQLVPGTDFVMAPIVAEPVSGAVFVEGDDNMYLPVETVEVPDYRDDVYNFEVDEDHTYVVSNAVVHNCQDYSVAKPLSKSAGIQGKKGVLWWSIYRFLQLKQPKYCLFENVDRLLKSPASARGRDFAIVLACLCRLGYSVEWRVVNSAEYGFPQRRKRVFIYAEKDAAWDACSRLQDGVMSDALPIKRIPDEEVTRVNVSIPFDVYQISNTYANLKVSPFKVAGVAVPNNGEVLVVTTNVTENYTGTRLTLGDVLVDSDDVPDSYWVSDDQLDRWKYLKGSKRDKRVTKDGFEYWYTEGSMAFPDLLTNPSRTILTGEGGASASRFKHIIEVDGKYRRLVPDELDQLQTFPKGWTDTGMTDIQRAFCMGNALVVGVVHRIGDAITQRAKF